jgi:glycosyltransferase involved in cell wall biosynthesis
VAGIDVSSTVESPALGAVVVLWAPFPPERFSAGDRRPRDIASGMCVLCDRVTVVAPNGAVCPLLESDWGVRVAHLGGPRFSRRSPISRLRYWISATSACRGNRDGYVIFYNPPLLGSLSAFFLRSFFGLRVCVEICDRLSLAPRVGWLRRLRFKVSEQAAVRCAESCLVISTDLAAWVRAVCPGKPVAIAPIMVDTSVLRFAEANPVRARHALGVGSDALLVVYAGSTFPQHGVLELVLGFIDIRKEWPAARLVLAGREISDDALKVLLVELKGSDAGQAVLLPGYLHPSDLVDLLAAADVLVLPQLDEPANRNALPTKVAEYAAAGRAILATDVGDLSEYFVHGESIYFSSAASAEGLSAGLRALLSDPELRATLGRGAREAGTLFAPKSVMRRAFRDLAAQRSG